MADDGPSYYFTADRAPPSCRGDAADAVRRVENPQEWQKNPIKSKASYRGNMFWIDLNRDVFLVFRAPLPASIAGEAGARPDHSISGQCSHGPRYTWSRFELGWLIRRVPPRSASDGLRVLRRHNAKILNCAEGETKMSKVVCVLYDDPVDGYPKSYVRDDLPKLTHYPGGQTLPTPKKIDFVPGHLLGSVSGELGLRKSLEGQGHKFVVTSDKDGPNSVFERELPDAEIVISQPFWPAYLTAERIAKAPKLKLAIPAGIGSDHVDLQAAIDRGITVAEVTYCNSISVAEHVVMMILSLVRNYIPSYQWVIKGGWNIADCVERSYDVEGMHVGTVAAGRIGLAVLRRLKPFDMHLHYTDRHRLPEGVEKELGLTFHAKVEDMVRICDVVTINCPLHPETENLFDDKMIGRMKRGAYLVNTARGKICNP